MRLISEPSPLLLSTSVCRCRPLASFPFNFSYNIVFTAALCSLMWPAYFYSFFLLPWNIFLFNLKWFNTFFFLFLPAPTCPILMYHQVPPFSSLALHLMFPYLHHKGTDGLMPKKRINYIPISVNSYMCFNKHQITSTGPAVLNVLAN